MIQMDLRRPKERFRRHQILEPITRRSLSRTQTAQGRNPESTHQAPRIISIIAVLATRHHLQMNPGDKAPSDHVFANTSSTRTASPYFSSHPSRYHIFSKEDQRKLPRLTASGGKVKPTITDVLQPTIIRKIQTQTLSTLLALKRSCYRARSKGECWLIRRMRKSERQNIGGR
jgi:hypothetical protein